MRIIACTLAVFVGTAALGAEVYRSTDANGVVVYSDRPQDARAQPVYVPTPRPSSTPRTQPAASRQANEQAGDPPIIAEGIPVPRTERERNDERARNCNIARQRLQAYTTSRRLYRELPNGEREYLSDEQLDEARAKAAADVENWCS